MGKKFEVRVKPRPDFYSDPKLQFLLPMNLLKINSKPGTYILVLQSETSASAQIGRWGCLDVRPGYYLYVGSALGPGGVLARVSRHCRDLKSKHWHIDYLREFTNVVAVWYRYSPNRLEHRWAEGVAKVSGTEPVKGFGCSDCSCESHLFYSRNEPELARFAAAVRSSVYPGGDIIRSGCV
jgi:Uri superfamily endonuclease